MKGILLSILTLLLLSSNAYAIGRIESANDLLYACEAFERYATVSGDVVDLSNAPADAYPAV
jgi:hypothetical protein